MKPHIKRPTAQDIAAILAPSSETAQVKLHKPTYDYLAANLDGEGAVSDYVSNRITSELVRLSKMKDGTGGKPHKHAATIRQRNANRTNAMARWGNTPRKNSIRVRVFDEPHKAYMEIADRKQERTRVAGEIVKEWCEAIDRDALLEYCAANPRKPQRFVTLPKDAVDAAKVIANEFSVPFTKIICYILANEV